MELMAICFCIVHAFGYLDPGNTAGKAYSKVNEDVWQVISHHAEQKSNQYQPNRSDYDRSTDLVVSVSSEQGNEAVTSATALTLSTDTSTTSQAMTIAPGKVFESSPRTSPAIRLQTESSDSASKTRISLERVTTSDSNDSNRDGLRNATTFKKMPTQSKNAVNKIIDHYRHASSRGFNNNLEVHNISEIVAKYDEAGIHYETLLKQVVQELESGTVAVLKKAEAWVPETVEPHFAPFSNTPSYETRKTDVNASVESFPNVVEGTKAEGQGPRETEDEKMNQVGERFPGFERATNQRRNKRESNSTDTSNAVKIVAAKSENGKVLTTKPENIKLQKTNVAKVQKTNVAKVHETNMAKLQETNVIGKPEAKKAKAKARPTQRVHETTAPTQAAGDETG